MQRREEYVFTRVDLTRGFKECCRVSRFLSSNYVTSKCRNWGRGIREQDTGFKMKLWGKACGSSSSSAERFFSELRVITLITKKYSILKTTTTTAYHILNLPLSSQSPQMRPINFFLSTLLYTDQPTQKTAPPPVACLPFQPLPFQRSSKGDSLIYGSLTPRNR